MKTSASFRRICPLRNCQNSFSVEKSPKLYPSCLAWLAGRVEAVSQDGYFFRTNQSRIAIAYGLTPSQNRSSFFLTIVNLEPFGITKKYQTFGGLSEGFPLCRNIRG